jgi:coproporphyrinogen III oxidase-like Fe-S oxidoreductase
MTAGIPLALYVHMPWCVAKCPYCDFNSHQVPRAGLPERAYVDALLQDLEFAAVETPGARARVGLFRRRHARACSRRKRSRTCCCVPEN